MNSAKEKIPKPGSHRVIQIPLYAYIKEALRNKILGGAIAVHSKLPSEEQLTKEFKVSRITIRQALSELQREGLVFKVNGKGTFVSKPKTLLDATQLRGFAEAASLQGYETFARVISIKNIKSNQSIARQLNIATNSHVTRLQRLRYLNREPISYDVTYVRPELGAAVAAADLESRDIISILENECNINVTNARESIEAIWCDAPMAHLLHVAEENPILHIERAMFDQAQNPVLYENLYYQGNAFRYAIDRKRKTGDN